MAYQPKYAAKSSKAAAPRPAAQPKPEKKRSKLSMVLMILLGILVVPLSCWLTANLLLGIYENVGRPKQTVYSKTESLTIRTSFEEYVTAAMDGIRLGLTSTDQTAQGSESAQQTVVEPVRRRYWIEDGVQVAPEPNQNYFGETTDPASLQWLLEEAQWILDGQELHFNLDMQIYEGSKVTYYLDDSIFAVAWKEVHEGSVYSFAEVKVSHPSQFRRHLAGGEFGSDVQYFTTEMAQTVNAVVASAGDFHRFRDFGICVYEGQVKKVEGTYAETCMIDKNGNMKFIYGGEITKTADAQAYVDENDINFSLCFGPVLVDDYQVMDHTWYGVGEIGEGYARAALCQMDDLHYIVATANVEGIYQELPTVKTFQKYIAATGCRWAYCLDGGQTATIVMNDELVNRPAFGTQRQISDIIYFATAVPDGG